MTLTHEQEILEARQQQRVRDNEMKTGRYHLRYSNQPTKII